MNSKLKSLFKKGISIMTVIFGFIFVIIYGPVAFLYLDELRDYFPPGYAFIVLTIPPIAMYFILTAILTWSENDSETE